MVESQKGDQNFCHFVRRGDRIFCHFWKGGPFFYHGQRWGDQKKWDGLPGIDGPLLIKNDSSPNFYTVLCPDSISMTLNIIWCFFSWSRYCVYMHGIIHQKKKEHFCLAELLRTVARPRIPIRPCLCVCVCVLSMFNDNRHNPLLLHIVWPKRYLLCRHCRLQVCSLLCVLHFDIFL